MTTLHLPPMPGDAEPVIVPGLLSGLGLVDHDPNAWITDPNVRASLDDGLLESYDEFVTRISKEK
ncbi:hypothetical protein ABZT16_11315 [Streptomyces flaveolus]|uniref:hypothetical protein n=1 Tax=Streptomyces flaveolus TaxID=67297 RepID=UPI0033B07713